jgi:hypothetical protein
MTITTLRWSWRQVHGTPNGESGNGALRVYFDRRLRLEFHGSRINSDAELPAYRELNDRLGLTGLAGDFVSDAIVALRPLAPVRC